MAPQPQARLVRAAAALESLPEAIVLTLLAALPAFINTSTERVFEEEKSLLLRAAALLALPGLVLAWRRYRPFWRQAIVITCAALTTMMLIAAIVGVAGQEAFIGAYLRRHGFVTWAALATMFTAMCLAARSPAGRERLLVAVMLGSVWPSVYGLLQRVGVDPFSWGYPTEGFVHSMSTFGNHTFLGGYLAVVIPLTALCAWQSWRVLPLLAIQLAALVASDSRGVVVAIAAAAAVSALAGAWARVSKRALAAAVLALGVIGAILVFVPAARPAALVRAFDPRVGSARVRVVVWGGTLALMRASGRRLWFGYGPEGLHRVFPPYYSAEIGRLENTDALPDRAHNETLDTLVSAGILGVVLELCFFVAVVAGALRIANPRIRAGLAAASVAHIVEIQFGIGTVVSRLVFMCTAAMIVGTLVPAHPEAATVIVSKARRSRSRATERDGPAAPAGTFRWLVAAALVGAVSPWLGSLPAPARLQTPSGSPAELLGQLSDFSFATPFLYFVVLLIVFGVSWSIAASVRPANSAWSQSLGIVAAIVASIPLAITPSRADIFSKAGADFESRQQWPEAVTAYREATRLQPRQAYYLTGLGRALIKQALLMQPPSGEAALGSAREALARARAIDPSDPDHVRHLAGLDRVEAWALGESSRAARLTEADRLYSEVTRWAPGISSLWVEWGYVELDRQQFAHAHDLASHALALNNLRSDGWLLRGHVHLNQRNAAEALADYDDALRRMPPNADALRGRALALVALHRSDEAREALDRALQLAPQDPALLQLRAQLGRPTQ